MAVGARIQELRELRELTIDQVAEKTRLRKEIIVYIEKEQWGKLDLRVFVRNQIRLIADALEVEDSELLVLFDSDFPDSQRTFENVSTPATAKLDILDKQGKSVLPAKQNPKLIYVILGVLAVIAIGVFAFVSQSKQSDTLPDTDVTPTVTESVNPSASPTESFSSLGVSVVLQATGRSWITATGSAGNSLYSSFINSGDTITLTDPVNVALIIGDAGVVNVTVNDENLGYLGTYGSSVEITFPTE
ncbi:MAG: hypothetical protein RLZZ330_1009 [Actinomycetota bacterium]|jgi:cytoskeletal protein RodZ